MMQMQMPVPTLHQSGLSDADIERLIWLKFQIEQGRRTEIPLAHKRLLFFRYLYESGRLHD